MSFQMSTATALPAEVQLAKEKPQGAFCLRTRYALSANSANSWNASSLVSLPLQTGTPGTFTDVKQGCINCTLQINNTNAYVDYLNFGPCGAIIFFDEMRVYSSGTPVEENLRYSETVDLLMEQGGWQDQPYHVYRRNKWRANNGAAKDKHLNFVKPAMVDSTGTPMFGRTPFMDKNSAVYQPASFALGYSGSNTTGTAITDGTLATSVTDLGSKTVSVQVINSTTVSHGQIFGTDCTGYFNDEAFQPTTVATVQGIAAYASRADSLAATTAAAAGLGRLVVGRNSHITYYAGTRIPSSSIGAWRNTQVAHYQNTGSIEVLYPWLPCATYTPALWPDYQPSTLQGEVDDAEIDTFIGKTKLCEYFKYLSNVRSLPIGLPGSLVSTGGLMAASDSYASAGQQLDASSGGYTNTGNNNFTEYRVSMPFVSGIYGILADKMFPDLLIGANNIRIEFKLASNQKALWLTMDPCRRVPGTVRDFAPFTGSGFGTVRQCKAINVLGVENTAGGNGLAQFDAANAALGCSFAGLCYYTGADIANYSTGSTTAAATAAGVLNGGIVPNSHMYTTASAMGEDFGISVHPCLKSTATTVSFPNSMGFGAGTAASSGAGFTTSNQSNLPKPQYIPVSTPWVAKAFSANSNYVNERASCYGTYLPASVPQTRRCQVTSRLDVSDNFNNAGITVFAIRDLQYIGEQVQLDDISTSAIIQHAASSEIVVWTRGYRSFEANCTQGVQQNIILPIQIGQATALYLVFRAAAQLTSVDYYSNAFYNPFTGLSFSSSSTTASTAGVIGKQAKSPDVGGIYSLKSTLDTSSMGAFSYQLFSGTKQYPLQPIQTVSEMIVEREKSTHSLHNWNWCSSEAMSLSDWMVPQNALNLTGLSFDPFLDMGFFTTFVPVAALDDQTITQNPYYVIAEIKDDATAGTRVRGIRQEAYKAPGANNGFVGVLNKFVPPIGTFYLGWDFESWTNHEDLMRTGKFLGQEQLSIRMTGCELMNCTNVLSPSNGAVGVTTQIGCTAIVPHVVKMSFVPGGHMLTYY